MAKFLGFQITRDKSVNKGLLTTPKDTFQLLATGSRIGFRVLDTQGIVKGYAECPPLSAIINKKGRASNNGVHRLYNTRGNEVKTENNYLRLIDSPNPCITGNQFRINSELIAQMFGFCIILKSYSVGFEDMGPTSLWIVPPLMVDVKWKNDYLYSNDILDCIESIHYCPPNVNRIALDKQDIYIITGEQPSLTHPYLTESVLTGQEEVISGLINIFGTMNSLIESRGAIGMITPGGKDGMGNALPLLPQQKEDVQAEFRRFGTLKDQFKYIITNQSLNFQQISAPIRDMMLNENAKMYTEMLCDAIGFPYPLLAGGTETQYNNANAKGKELYTDYVIPTDNQWCKQFDEMTGIKDAGYYTAVDYSHLSILQEDQKLKSEVKKNNVASIRTQFLTNMISWDNALIQLGEQPIKGENGAKFYYQLPLEIQKTFNHVTANNQTTTNESGNTTSDQGQTSGN